DARELLIERADPAEPGRDRVRVRPDVVAVQGVADLEPQRVPRTEPARHRAALEHAIPELRALVRLDQKLASALPGIAGPVDRACDPVDLSIGERERRRVR